jgi:hypothetical protein
MRQHEDCDVKAWPEKCCRVVTTPFGWSPNEETFLFLFLFLFNLFATNRHLTNTGSYEEVDQCMINASSGLKSEK